MGTINRQSHYYKNYADFVASLNKYVHEAKSYINRPIDELLLILAEQINSVFKTDLIFMGFHNVSQLDKLDPLIHIDQKSIKPDSTIWHPALKKRLIQKGWAIPYDDLKWVSSATTLCDEGLNRLPIFPKNIISAIAIARIQFSEMEYFIFFCDTQPKEIGIRYESYHQKMLEIAVGILEICFINKMQKREQINFTNEDYTLLKELKEGIRAAACSKARNLIYIKIIGLWLIPISITITVWICLKNKNDVWKYMAPAIAVTSFFGLNLAKVPDKIKASKEILCQKYENKFIGNYLKSAKGKN